MSALSVHLSAIPLGAATTLERSPETYRLSRKLVLPLAGCRTLQVKVLSPHDDRFRSEFFHQDCFSPSFNALSRDNNTLKNWFSVHAAWTRRSSGQEPRKSKKSFKQRTEKYMKPFILDIFISSKYVHAKVMHRVTSKVVSVATTNAKDLRYSLPSLTDANACKTIGKLIADRSKEADVYAVTFELRKGEKLEGKLATVLDTVVENGITLV